MSRMPSTKRASEPYLRAASPGLATKARTAKAGAPRAPTAVAARRAVQRRTSAEDLFDRVATILDEARSSVVRAVNSQMVVAYWYIGREIVEALQRGERRADYGARLMEELSSRLTQRYGKGFSTTNLWDFRQFYQTYPDRQPGTEILRPSGGELAQAPAAGFLPSLSWSHYRALMRVEKPEARAHYEQEAAACGWSKADLERQIETLSYERLLLGRDKKGILDRARRAGSAASPVDVLKDPYVLEFLALPDTPELRESQLELALLENLQRFLLELGKGFSFVARQKRMRLEDEDFFVDLVFYNYILKCFVLIDLKVGRLTHQDIGQMDSYVRMFEAHERLPGDNPTIGLILCSRKNEAVAKYSVLHESRQLFAARYITCLPTEEELARELERERRLAEAHAAPHAAIPAALPGRPRRRARR